MNLTSDRLRSNAKAVLPAADRSRSLWRQMFSATSKEDGIKPDPVASNSWTRSIVGDESTKRLLQALRSRAPGGWTDDRWEQSRHFYGIPYVAIHRIGTQLQQAEFQVFVKDDTHPDGKRPISPNDPPHGNRQVKPYDLVKLLGRPNKQDSFGKLMYRWNQQLRLTGTALTWMVPNMLGVPMELYCVPTATAVPQPASNPDYPEGFYRIQPLYPYGPFSSYPAPATAVGAPIPAQWMLRFLYPHPLLRYEGFSPLSGLRQHIDQHEAMDRSRWYNMKRTFRPSAVLNMDGMDGATPLPEPEIERIRAEFESSQMGPENVGNLFVATPGAKLEEWGSRPVDMDYGSSWDQVGSFILGGGFGITKPAAGMIEDSSYSTLFATLKQLNLLTLDPDCSDIASELTHHLAPFFGDDLIIEIRCRRIDDHDVKRAKLETLVQAKAITKNELRKELEMPLTDKKWGDEIAGTEEAQEMPGAGQAPGPAGISGQSEQIDEAKDGPAPVANSRPRPDSLGTGALGPRAKAMKIKRKSMYRRVTEEVCKNGRNGHA